MVTAVNIHSMKRPESVLSDNTTVVRLEMMKCTLNIFLLKRALMPHQRMVLRKLLS